MRKLKTFLMLLILTLFVCAQAWSATLIMYPKFKGLDSSGTPLVGGLLYTYKAGTTTPKATYTSRAATTPNANPVVLDSNGEATVYGTGTYKFVLKTAAGATVWTMDNLKGNNEIDFTTIADYDNDFDAAITAIGATETTLYIDEAATMSANTTVPSTCTIVLQKGGSIAQSTYNLAIQGPLRLNGGTISGSGTLTVTGQISGSDYQAISTTGTITIDDFVKSVWVPSLNVAVESAAQVVEITPNITNTITSTINVNSNQTIYGFGDKSLVNFGANIDGFTIDGKSNVIIRDFKIDGKKSTYSTTSNNAISSPANGTGSSNIRIEGMTIVDVAGNSIEILAQSVSHSENVMILNNAITDSGGDGIITQDYVDDVMIRGNRIINYALIVSSTAGIATGRDSNNQQVIGNYIEDGGSSLGVSPHGITLNRSTNSVISGNIVNGAQGYGIEIGFCTNVSVTGNEIYSTTKAGIALPGDDSNNYVSKHVSITGNTIYQPGYAGIYSFVDNYVDDKHEDITVVGNTIYANQADPGIYLGWTKNSLIEGNTIANSYKAGVHLTYCDYIVTNGNNIKNSNTSATAGHYYGVLVESTSTYCPVNGLLTVEPESTSTSGTGEDTLYTIDIPQYYYKDWHGLRLTAVGIKTGSAGNKTIKFKWGAGSFIFNAAANDVNDWTVTVDVLFRNWNQQRVEVIGYNATTMYHEFVTRTEDMSVGNTTMTITGECADGADSISIQLIKLEVF